MSGESATPSIRYSLREVSDFVARDNQATIVPLLAPVCLEAEQFGLTLYFFELCLATVCGRLLILPFAL
jgi:hypothetical protein